MNKSHIAPAIFQDQLEAARNAGRKGQAQWFTPPEWAERLARPLPGWRHTLVDLCCGNLSLLQGAAAPGTHRLLGCDIEPLPTDDERCLRVTGDLTRFQTHLRTVDFQADLFVLNPPWDHHWSRAALDLAASGCPAVALACSAWDGRTPRDCLDSTIASLGLALEFMSPWGEGACLANEATLQRLIFAPDAPHAALRAHVWAHLVIAGNPCLPAARSAAFQTGVLYFARGHTAGPLDREFGDQAAPLHGASEVDQAVAALQRDAHALRQGPRPKLQHHTDATAEQWQAAAEQWRFEQQQRLPGENPFNLWLEDGVIRTQLNLYDQHSGRAALQEALQLHTLAGRTPAALILTVPQRRCLQQAAFGSVWRVQPALQDAVRQALADYEAVRSPLYPLHPVQRLGYLDEQETVLCLRALGPFAAGQRYRLRAETLRATESGEKLNLEGFPDDVLWERSELAFWLTDAAGTERLFMDARLRQCQLSLQRRPQDPSPIEFTHQQLLHHFDIPDVPDVSTRDPQRYQHYLDLLTRIEHLANATHD